MSESEYEILMSQYETMKTTADTVAYEAMSDRQKKHNVQLGRFDKLDKRITDYQKKVHEGLSKVMDGIKTSAIRVFDLERRLSDQERRLSDQARRIRSLEENARLVWFLKLIFTIN